MGLPGVQIEFGEYPDSAFVREVQEETGIIITPLLPFYTFTWTYQKENQKKQIVAMARLGIYHSGTIRESTAESEVVLQKAQWI